MSQWNHIQQKMVWNIMGEKKSLMGVGEAISPLLGHVGASNQTGPCKKLKSGGSTLDSPHTRAQGNSATETPSLGRKRRSSATDKHAELHGQQSLQSYSDQGDTTERKKVRTSEIVPFNAHIVKAGLRTHDCIKLKLLRAWEPSDNS